MQINWSENKNPLLPFALPLLILPDTLEHPYGVLLGVAGQPFAILINLLPHLIANQYVPEPYTVPPPQPGMI